MGCRTDSTNLVATYQDFKMQLAAVDAQTSCRASMNSGTCTFMMQPLKFDGSISWTVFHCQFKAVADHNVWEDHEKAVHLFAI
jgi:hypothetical protein